MSSASTSPRRVVITGLGVISPIGTSKDALWDSLVAGRSGVAPLEALPAEHLPTSFAGEVRDFHGVIGDFGDLEGARKKAVRKSLKVMCRECQMGVAAALRALSDAGLDSGNFDPERAGIVYGSDLMLSPPEEFTAGIRLCTAASGRFDFSRWGGEGMRKMTPLWLLKYLPNMPACHIAIFFDLRGPNNSLTQREASSMLAVGEAYRTITRRHADIMVAGATGTRVHAMKTLHTVQQEEIAGNGFEPARASRPFDLNRCGMVLGEGASALVLEELRSAEARGATIYGEVIGAGSSFVANRNLVARRDVALANAMRATMRDAGCSPEDVGHVNAHGLSTRRCDAEEARAIRDVFGKLAERIPVTAAKSYFGNLGAGSGATELVASLLAMQNGRLFPILNYETPDSECLVPAVRTTDTPPGRCVLKLSVTPQGQAACVMVRSLD